MADLEINRGDTICELQFGGRSLGKFTRAQLTRLHSMLSCVLEVELELAQAWLRLPDEQSELIGRIMDVMASFFSQRFALGTGTNARERRIACKVLREFAPDVPTEAIAAALRLCVPRVEANVRWLAGLEMKDEHVARDMATLRGYIRTALEALPQKPSCKGAEPAFPPSAPRRKSR
jgi:hypothetical protein